MQLSDHFTLEEFTFSETAARHGLPNVPGWPEYGNLQRMATVMEFIRNLLEVPIIVHSGYRSPELNKLIGGVETSAHCKGLACDFVAPKFGTPYEVAKAIEPHVAEFRIDQLIREFGWTHVGLSVGEPRHQLLTKRSASSPYEQGIRPDPFVAPDVDGEISV